MRLWHQLLIPYLDKNRLLGQHRECCALRGNGWNKPHATVNYVFKYSPALLIGYHIAIIEELEKLNCKIDRSWKEILYRGKNCRPWPEVNDIPINTVIAYLSYLVNEPIFPEHNQEYLEECIQNLKSKNFYFDENLIGNLHYA